MKKYISALAALLAFSTIVSAQTTTSSALPSIDTGDTAWMIVATALVLFMGNSKNSLFF